MKIRYALALAALLPILAACKADDAAPTTRPRPHRPPGHRRTGRCAGHGQRRHRSGCRRRQAPAEAAPAAAAPTTAALTGPAPVEGADYQVIPNGQPFRPAWQDRSDRDLRLRLPGLRRIPAAGRPVETGLPSDVNFVYVPAMFGGTWDDYARAFYAAQTLGVQEKTHEALYAAIHSQKTLKGERGRDSVEDIAKFYAAYGVDRSSSPPPWAASR